MEKYSQNNYALKFSGNYKQLLVIDLDTDQSYGQPIDLTQGVKVHICEGDYVIERNTAFQSDPQKFVPAEFVGILDEPLRFVGDEWIGSGDLRDTRIPYNDYKYHLKDCPISLTYTYEGDHPTIEVRVPCPSGDCPATPPTCCTVISIPRQN